MTQRGLFRVLMKAVGIYFMIEGGVTVLYYAAQLIFAVVVEGGISNRWVWSSVVPSTYSAAQLAAGVYLFFAGRFILDLAFPRGPSRCHECGYDLSGNDTHICPECATKVTRVQQSQGETP